ncbi:hypothetical protein K450DRAFT_259387 [Umbelopsis ramanniana AG]|uniref:Little elongation complex subunit 2 C-terminal domain-containing protein n=1 Tax=Umbelopsis ramanniana AG TaxID=1314678 RepID=A0AAD5E2C9_UMBRA|nr:uncharacterized protein K450DRAFT_259387 [Umbelopsis ramanniana AG]KAI8575918.1 hypothetical protein K450DRAFT_259387 [Umbelopsis ramanniana AG]
MSPELRNRNIPSGPVVESEQIHSDSPVTSAQEPQSTPKRRGRPPSKNKNTNVEPPASTPPAAEEIMPADDAMQLDEFAESSGSATVTYTNMAPMEVIDSLRAHVSPTLPPTPSAGNTPNTSDNEMADSPAIEPPKKKRGRLVKGSVRHAAQLPLPPTPFKCGNDGSQAGETLFFTQKEFNDRSIYNLQKPFEMFKMASEPTSAKAQSAATTPKTVATPSPRPEGEAPDVLGGLLTSISAQSEARLDLKSRSKNVSDSVPLDYSANTPSSERGHSEHMDDLTIAAVSAGVPLVGSGERSQAKYPRMSRFSREEHLKYMQTSELLRSNPSLVSGEDRSAHGKMSREVEEEKKEFLQWQLSQIRDSDAMNKVDANISRILDQHYALERERVASYPATYEFQNSVSVFAKVLRGQEPILVHKNLLKRQGSLFRCEFPSKLPMAIPFKDTYFSSRKKDDRTYVKQPEIAIAQDSNIPKMVTDHNVHVVATSKSLSSIVALEKDRDYDLDIPIRIVEPHPSDTTQVKTVYIDDPFTEPSMNNRQRAEIVYDAVLKSITLNQNQKQSIDHQGKSMSEETAQKTETGVISPNTVSLMKDTDPTLDTHGSDDYAVNEAKPRERNDDNSIYNLWTFGNINLLVRWHADGYIGESEKANPGTETRMVVLKSKVDFYLHMGYKETMTAGDRARQWMTSFLQGHAPIYEGRIDPTTNSLVRIERREMVDIMADRWRPVQESEMLRQLLIKLRGLDVGDYLLRYSKGNYNLDIWKHNSDASKGYNLHHRYRDIKIDPEPAHVPAWSGSKEQIPFTFPIAGTIGKKQQHKAAPRRGYL